MLGGRSISKKPPAQPASEKILVPRVRFALALATALLVTSARANAQMFGQREIGGFLSRQQTPGAVSNPAEGMIQNSGSLTGTERFLRGNRRPTDFVGTDSGDGAGLPA